MYRTGFSRGMFFTGSNRQMFPMIVAFNVYHAKFLINSVFPRGYVTTENKEIKMVKAKLKMRTASNFTTRRGKIIEGLKSALLWVPTVALLLLGFQKMHMIL